MVMPAGAKKNNAVGKNIKAVTPQSGKIIFQPDIWLRILAFQAPKSSYTSQEAGTGSVFVINGETGQILQRFDIGTAP